MDDDDLKKLMVAFDDLPDPRSERNQDYSLMSILMIALCGAISGADNWVDIEGYGRAKQSWLETLIDLPHGIPSHDTFGGCFGSSTRTPFRSAF